MMEGEFVQKWRTMLLRSGWGLLSHQGLDNACTHPCPNPILFELSYAHIVIRTQKVTKSVSQNRLCYPLESTYYGISAQNSPSELQGVLSDEGQKGRHGPRTMTTSRAAKQIC